MSKINWTRVWVIPALCASIFVGTAVFLVVSHYIHWLPSLVVSFLAWTQAAMVIVWEPRFWRHESAEDDQVFNLMWYKCFLLCFDLMIFMILMEVI